MTKYRFFDEVDRKFREAALASRAAAEGFVSVEAMRKVADRAAAEYVAEIKTNGTTAEIVALYPELLERRAGWENATIGDLVREIVEEDLVRVLDVRREWADQFPDDYAPAQAMAAEAEVAVAFFERVSTLDVCGIGLKVVRGYDELEREEVCGAARAAIANYIADPDPRSLDDLFAAMAPVVGSLRDLHWQAAIDRFLTSVEAFNRLGRAPDGSWELAW